MVQSRRGRLLRSDFSSCLVWVWCGLTGYGRGERFRLGRIDGFICIVVILVFVFRAIKCADIALTSLHLRFVAVAVAVAIAVACRHPPPKRRNNFELQSSFRFVVRL